MEKFYKTPTNEVMVIEVGQEFLVQTDWVLMTTAEEGLFKNPPKTPEQLLASLKAIKDKAVADKLALLQYDSLATVKLWADDATFGTEATKILTWYKALTLMSITLENDVKAGTKPMPTEAEYEALVIAVIF